MENGDHFQAMINAWEGRKRKGEEGRGRGQRSVCEEQVLFVLHRVSLHDNGLF